MDINDYQKNVREYIDYPKEIGPYSVILSLVKNMGKLSEKLNDVLINNHGSFDDKKRMNTIITLGDIIFDVTNMASDLDYTMNDVLSINLMKYQNTALNENNKENM